MPACRLPAVLLLLGSIAIAAPTAAQEFRIESAVHVDGAGVPTSEHLTLFDAAAVYDFSLTSPDEITVFDRGSSRIILLNVSRKQKTTLTLEQLADYADRLKAEGANVRPGVRFFYDPEFETSYDEKTGQLTLSGKPLDYTAKGIKPPKGSDGAVRRYREFADWQSRLNSVYPGNPPPFPRLALNAELAELGVVPTEVELTLKRLLTKKRFKSKHVVIWKLGGRDRGRIDEVGRHLANFEPVSWQEFTGKKVAARE